MEQGARQAGWVEAGAGCRVEAVEAAMAVAVLAVSAVENTPRLIASYAVGSPNTCRKLEARTRNGASDNRRQSCSKMCVDLLLPCRQKSQTACARQA